MKTSEELIASVTEHMGTFDLYCTDAALLAEEAERAAKQVEAGELDEGEALLMLRDLDIWVPKEER